MGSSASGRGSGLLVIGVAFCDGVKSPAFGVSPSAAPPAAGSLGERGIMSDLEGGLMWARDIHGKGEGSKTTNDFCVMALGDEVLKLRATIAELRADIERAEADSIENVRKAKINWDRAEAAERMVQLVREQRNKFEASLAEKEKEALALRGTLNGTVILYSKALNDAQALREELARHKANGMTCFVDQKETLAAQAQEIKALKEGMAHDVQCLGEATEKLAAQAQEIEALRATTLRAISEKLFENRCACGNDDGEICEGHAALESLAQLKTLALAPEKP